MLLHVIGLKEGTSNPSTQEGGDQGEQSLTKHRGGEREAPHPKNPLGGKEPWEGGGGEPWDDQFREKPHNKKNGWGPKSYGREVED